MGYSKIYGLFCVYDKRTVGYVGPTGDVLTSQAFKVKIRQMDFSRTHVKVFYKLDEANRKLEQIRARVPGTETFLVRLSRHSGIICKDLSQPYQRDKKLKNTNEKTKLKIVRFVKVTPGESNGTP